MDRMYPDFMRRKFYAARVMMDVRMRNLDVNRAFRISSLVHIKKKGVAAVGAGVVVAMLSIISYAITSPAKATIGPEVTPVAETVAMAAPSPAHIAKANTQGGVAPVIRPVSFTPPANTQVEKQAMAAPVPMMASPMPADTATDDEDVFDDDISINGATLNLANLPGPSLTMPTPSGTAPYTLAIDKTNGILYVLEDARDNYRIVKQYTAAFGSEKGDKLEAGDNRTPEGVYKIVKVKEKPTPASKYGPIAFVLDYPNVVDVKKGKTGSGIWLHGTGIGEAMRNTQGCVALNDINIAALEKYAAVGAAVYIFPEGFEIPVKNMVIQKNIISPDTLYAVKEWKERAVAKSKRKIVRKVASNSQMGGM